ncbi:MAG: hypothetical protein IKZ28_04500, partial [Clostridia bacterium]|nr:hypothetical protein [Clostridia bacterium]
GSWTDDIEFKNDMKSWTTGGYHQFADASRGATKVEDWFAWANGGTKDSFAMGVYIPNVTQFTSGRSNTSTAYYTGAEFENANAKPIKECGTVYNGYTLSDNAKRGNILAAKGMLSNMQPVQYTYQSTYVSNTSYNAPGIGFRMAAYVPIEYSYVICLGTVNNIRSTFKTIKDNGTITNAGGTYEKVGLDAWARADKTWTH